VRVEPIEPDAGVEVELLALESPSLVGEPLEERAAVSAAPRRRQRRQVVDVEEPAPGEHVPDPEAGDRDRVLRPLLEHADEPVTLPALHLVDAVDELVLVGELRPQLPQGREGESSLGREELPECRQASTIASIASSTSLARNGIPRTRLKPVASTRNSARISFTSWPRLISGTSTFG
jgi:hypothetical protein